MTTLEELQAYCSANHLAVSAPCDGRPFTGSYLLVVLLGKDVDMPVGELAQQVLCILQKMYDEGGKNTQYNGTGIFRPVSVVPRPDPITPKVNFWVCALVDLVPLGERGIDEHQAQELVRRLNEIRISRGDIHTKGSIHGLIPVAVAGAPSLKTSPTQLWDAYVVALAEHHGLDPIRFSCGEFSVVTTEDGIFIAFDLGESDAD